MDALDRLGLEVAGLGVAGLSLGACALVLLVRRSPRDAGWSVAAAVAVIVALRAMALVDVTSTASPPGDWSVVVLGLALAMTVRNAALLEGTPRALTCVAVAGELTTALLRLSRD